ncbi:MAG TPA: mannose-6-phosphate isomerase, class I [Puia sp.]|nr:mannose-6-phosphate isomerase, class I [Puia sp.]
MNPDKNKVFRLEGNVKYYPWGGVSFLPELLKIPNPQNKPFAEYWMGAHDESSSTIFLKEEQKVRLNEYIHRFPSETLGEDIAKKFGRLPYLLKILDVRNMLSIQVHPSKKNAEIEFARENNSGLDPGSLLRNYRDDNHKPELMMALDEFWLLHGFKPVDRMKQVLQRVSELIFLSPVFDKGYEALYRKVMQMEQAEVDKILKPLLVRIIPAYQNKSLKKDNEDFWAARAALTFNREEKIDRGIFSIYLFNLVHLQPGEAVFQDAGLPHAYLEGQNVEIMANSDNVLRGGLTSKRIDVTELMKQVQFEATIPNIIHYTSVDSHVGLFVTPAPDFELGRINLKQNETLSLRSHSAEIFIVLQGSLKVHENESNEFFRGMGEAWISFDKAGFTLRAVRDSTIYYGSVPRCG